MIVASFVDKRIPILSANLVGQPPPPFQPLRNGPEDREILKY